MSGLVGIPEDRFSHVAAKMLIGIHCRHEMSRLMGKPTICICENKDADQLRGNREADQRLCFRYKNSTLHLLFKSEISSFQPASVTVQLDLCRTCSETTLLVFPRGGSNNEYSLVHFRFCQCLMCTSEGLHNSRLCLKLLEIHADCIDCTGNARKQNLINAS